MGGQFSFYYEGVKKLSDMKILAHMKEAHMWTIYVYTN